MIKERRYLRVAALGAKWRYHIKYYSAIHKIQDEKSRGFWPRRCIRACIWYTSISRPSSYFTRDIGFFQPFFPASRSFIIPPRRRHLRHGRALYTKQSNLESVATRRRRSLHATARWQFIYPGHLCNNLLTRYVFLARGTTFSRLCTPGLVTARESHCCATVRKNTMRIHTLEDTIESSKIFGDYFL